MAHRTRVLEVPGKKYVGICSCGWVTSRNSDKQAVVLETNGHLVNGITEDGKAKQTPELK